MGKYGGEYVLVDSYYMQLFSDYKTILFESKRTNRLSTDDANKKHFDGFGKSADHHSGVLPVPSYKLATDKAFDGEFYRGSYSFCMCPGM